MKNIFIWLLCMMSVTVLLAQNNPIFGGGNADGVDRTNFAQASNGIFNGGGADGWGKTNFTQAENNIFNGSAGDGSSNASFAQVINNIFNGGIGDGWDKTSFAQSLNNIFNGGAGDGWDKALFAQAGNNIFFGGIGDGWASTYRPMGPLPITLAYFTAQKINKTTSILQWKTLQEINTAGFEIERSNDAMGFKKIGDVRAAGNSGIGSIYSFVDNNPAQGVNYYRLKQLDIDGKFIYTPVRLVVFDGLDAANVKYYPNPTTGLITIELAFNIENETGVLNICNAAGVVANQIKIVADAGKKIKIDLTGYAKGIYFIQVKSASVNSTERIILY